MNMELVWRIVVPIAFYLLFWSVCFLCTGTDEKNVKSLSCYPKTVREKVGSDPKLSPLMPKKKNHVIVMLGNVLLFGVVFFLLGLVCKKICGLDSYLSAFLYWLAVGEGLNLFDLAVIDCLWWRHSRRIRISVAPDPDDYLNPYEHIMSFLRGIPVFVAVGAISALSSLIGG